MEPLTASRILPYKARYLFLSLSVSTVCYSFLHLNFSIFLALLYWVCLLVTSLCYLPLRSIPLFLFASVCIGAQRASSAHVDPLYYGIRGHSCSVLSGRSVDLTTLRLTHGRSSTKVPSHVPFPICTPMSVNPPISYFANAVYYPNWAVYSGRPPSFLNLPFISHIFYAFAWYLPSCPKTYTLSIDRHNRPGSDGTISVGVFCNLLQTVSLKDIASSAMKMPTPISRSMVSRAASTPLRRFGSIINS